MNRYACEIRKRKFVAAKDWLSAKKIFLNSVEKGEEEINVNIKLVVKNKK